MPTSSDPLPQTPPAPALPAMPAELADLSFRSSPIAASVARFTDGLYVDVNEAFLRQTGYTRAEVIGRTVEDLKVWERPEARQRVRAALLAHGLVRDAEYKIRVKSGELRQVLAAMEMVDVRGELYVLAMYQDITERGRIEDALRASEARFRRLFESVPLPVLVYQLDTRRFLDVNAAACQHYGYTRAELLELTLDDLGAVPSGQAVDTGLMRHRTKDGRESVVEVTIDQLQLDDQPAGIAVVRDVTEQRRMQADLRSSEERFELVVRATADAVYDWNIRTGLTRWNHGMRTLFGYPVDDQQAHQWWRDQVHPDDREATIASVTAALDNREQFWQAEYRYRRADGSYAHVYDRGYVLYDAAREPVRMVGAMIDVTERVALAEAQARAALEERQRLARELHDSVTQSLYSLTLLAEAGRRLAAAGDLERVGQYVGRLGETAQQALKEMRLLVYQLRPLALETDGLVGALQHRLDAVEKRAGLQARLVVEPATGLLDLPAAGEETLFRVAHEALNNALKHAGHTAVTLTLCAGGGWAGLEVADDGRGFDPAAVPGGGLGLTSMRERLEALGGTLTITSRPSAGTRVLARLRTESAP